ncbi:Uncharacterised protein [Collinsella intestinalis]|nr:Uncharacterised protein [Collinsella intestinalis]
MCTRPGYTTTGTPSSSPTRTVKLWPSTGIASVGNPSISLYGMWRTTRTRSPSEPRPLPSTMASGCSIVGLHHAATFSNVSSMTTVLSPCISRRRVEPLPHRHFSSIASRPFVAGATRERPRWGAGRHNTQVQRVDSAQKLVAMCQAIAAWHIATKTADAAGGYGRKLLACHSVAHRDQTSRCRSACSRRARLAQAAERLRHTGQRARHRPRRRAR